MAHQLHFFCNSQTVKQTKIKNTQIKIQIILNNENTQYIIESTTSKCRLKHSLQKYNCLKSGYVEATEGTFGTTMINNTIPLLATSNPGVHG